MGRKTKQEIKTLTKKLIIYSERLATNYNIKTPDKDVQNFVDSIKIIDIANELKVLLEEPYKQPKSKYKQLEIAYDR